MMAGRRPWKTDPRDQGRLPENLEALSYSMAMFLRHDAYRRSLCDREGWVQVDLLLTELVSGRCRALDGDLEIATRENVKTVIETSYSKDKPRFQSRTSEHGYLFVRSTKQVSHHQHFDRHGRDGQHYEQTARRGRYRFHGRCDLGETTSCFQAQRPPLVPGAEVSSPAQTSPTSMSPANPQSMSPSETALDHENSQPQCTVEKDRLQSKDESDHAGTPAATHGQSAASVGVVMSDARHAIQLESGDRGSQAVEAVEGCQQHESEHPAACDSPWPELRTLGSWDAKDHGTEYLSLVKGELLSVRPGLVDGWAYGFSLSRNCFGWFPPSYAAPDATARG